MEALATDTPGINRLLEEARWLVAILSHPHPDVTSWLEMANRRLVAIGKFIPACPPGGLTLTDSAILDWLQDQIVDTIYLDNGRIIDVKGGDLRAAIAQRKGKGWPDAIQEGE